MKKKHSPSAKVGHCTTVPLQTGRPSSLTHTTLSLQNAYRNPYNKRVNIN